VNVQAEKPAIELKRQLSLFDATMVNVGTVLASGIFLVPASIALLVPASGPNLAVWLVGGVLAMFGAFTLAELSGLMPHTGGLFVFLEKAFSPLWGFLYGWALFLVIQTGTIAALGVAFATYLGHFWPLSDLEIKLVAVASIIVLTALNCRGVRLGVWTLNLLTVIKVAIIVIVLGWTLKPGTLQAENFAPLWPTDWDFEATKLWGLALIGVLWAYDGWVDVTLVAGEVKNPEKNLHRSLVLSMVIIIAIYLLMNLAYIAVLSVAGMAGRLLVAADFATVVMGVVGAGFVAFLVMISCLGANNGFVFTGPRVYYAMSREGLFFKGVGKLHPSYGTPFYSLILQGVWACVLVFLMGTYEELFTSVVFASWVFYALAAAGVIVLRRKHPNWNRPYLCWGYPWVPIVFVVAAVALIANTFATDLRSSVIGTILMSTGLPAYWFWSQRRGRTEDRVAPGSKE
jgi:APA family basic amino acid/polyamine antiporter